jgi:hypothetical protein
LPGSIHDGSTGVPGWPVMPIGVALITPSDAAIAARTSRACRTVQRRGSATPGYPSRSGRPEIFAAATLAAAPAVLIAAARRNRSPPVLRPSLSCVRLTHNCSNVEHSARRRVGRHQVRTIPPRG